MSNNRKDYSNALIEVMNYFNKFYNLFPQKELGDKSPLEKGKEEAQKDLLPDIKISVTDFPHLGWLKKHRQAIKYSEQNDFRNALKKFNEIFAYLLKHKITYPEIYRMYAHKGVCHFKL